MGDYNLIFYNVLVIFQSGNLSYIYLEINSFQ